MKAICKKVLGVLSVAAIMTTTSSYAQIKVGNNPEVLNPNAALEIESADRGLLLPRVALVNTTNPAPLVNHVAGMQVYNTTNNPVNGLFAGIYVNDGQKWTRSDDSPTLSNMTEGEGAPTGSCSTPGEMYTDIGETSPTQGKVWICSGGTWVELTTAVQSTKSPFNFGNIDVDAGENKTSRIWRSGDIVVTGSAGLIGILRNGTGSQNASAVTANGLFSQVSGPDPNLHLSKNTALDGDTFLSCYQDENYLGGITRKMGTGVIFSAPSDRRLKENIKDTHYSIKDLLKISVKDYNFISDSSKTVTSGFIAQELYEIYPHAVSKGGDDVKTNPWQVDYGKLTPLLVKAIQDQQKEIELQNKQIALQEKEIGEMKLKINERLAQLEQKSLKKQNRVSKRLAKKKDSGILVYTQKAIQ